MFEILLFDIDDTLLDFHKAEFNAFQQVCKQYNIEWNEEFYNTYKEINLSCWKQLEKGLLKRTEVYTKRFDELFSIYKYTIELESNEYLTSGNIYTFTLNFFSGSTLVGQAEVNYRYTGGGTE